MKTTHQLAIEAGLAIDVIQTHPDWYVGRISVLETFRRLVLEDYSKEFPSDEGAVKNAEPVVRYVGDGKFAPVVTKHGLKVGDPLFAHPQACPKCAELNNLCAFNEKTMEDLLSKAAALEQLIEEVAIPALEESVILRGALIKHRISMFGSQSHNQQNKVVRKDFPLLDIALAKLKEGVR